MSNQEPDGRSTYRRRKRSQMHAEAEAEVFQDAEIADHPMVVVGRPELVVNAADLVELAQAIRKTGSFAYDTEFIGEETFLPRICLVQVACAGRLALVDPLEVSDLGPIFELVADPEIETLVHDGAQDLEPVRRLLGKEPQGIVDTQVCAGFLDMPWPSSLAKAVERFAAHALSKGHTFTDWDARPLTDRQVRYAADDVRFLPLVWSRMQARLEANGRLGWALQECEESRRRHVGGFGPEKQMRKISRGSRLKAKSATVLREIVKLRHELAEEQNLPHRVTMSDESVAEVARIQPQDVEGLQRCRHLGRRNTSEFAERIIAAVKRGIDGPPQPFENLQTRDENAEERMRIDAIWSALSLRCLADGIAPNLLTSRANLAQWYINRCDGKSTESLFLPESWRWEAAGRWLESFLDGKSTLDLRWDDGRLHRADDVEPG
ncbi:MAG: HRDC domain-containing protein [Planctomycetota bacterium]|nr:HRDC domain-containing protein [Planctomycetota bacterium]